MACEAPRITVSNWPGAGGDHEEAVALAPVAYHAFGPQIERRIEREANEQEDRPVVERAARPRRNVAGRGRHVEDAGHGRCSLELHIDELRHAPIADQQQARGERIVEAPAQRDAAPRANSQRAELVEQFDEHQDDDEAERSPEGGVPVVAGSSAGSRPSELEDPSDRPRLLHAAGAEEYRRAAPDGR